MAENIIVTAAGDVERVAGQLRAAGMNVQQVLSEVGIITGSVDAAQRDALAEVPGVDAVETEQRFQIAPPGAEIQSEDPSSQGGAQLQPPESEIQ